MSEQPKSTAPTQEHPYPQGQLVPFPTQGYNGGPYPPPGPPGAYMPPFFYPPHPDGSHPEGAPNGGVPPHFMIGLPPGVPGVLYAYPPPQTQQFGAPPANPAPSALSRPKRKQVKMACTNCAGACKRCDENRPCERCVKYGIADTCVDGQRKERKKGIKRGPYRRKNKNEADSPSFNGEWTPPSSSTTAAAIHAVAQYAPPEGSYYPVYYPPPGFMPHPPPPPEGHPNSSNSTPNPPTNPDGSPAHSNNGQPMMPYYIHPGGYPPFPHYPPTMYPGPPPPGAPHSQPQSAPPVQPPAPQTAAPEQQPPQTVNPAETAGKPADAPPPSGSANGAAAPAENGVHGNGTSKKRSRTGKNGEPRTKKNKVAAAGAAVAAEKGKDVFEGHETGTVPGGEEVSANAEAEAEKNV